MGGEATMADYQFGDDNGNRLYGTDGTSDIISGLAVPFANLDPGLALTNADFWVF
jgi:hypothetical protein